MKKTLTPRIKNKRKMFNKKTPLKHLIENDEDKYTELFKPYEKCASNNIITVLVCVTTIESYGSTSENVL